MMDIGEREKEGVCYKCPGILFNSLNERDKAEKYLKKALLAAAEVSNKERRSRLFQTLRKSVSRHR